MRAEHPDAWFVGEVIHGDYAARVRDAGFDSVTQYELWKAIWSSLNDGNFHELDWALVRHNEFLDDFVPMTFVGNHDVTRIASQLENTRHLEHALVLLFTTGGTPSVYAGDESAYRGVKEERFGGDDAVRPEFTAPLMGVDEHGHDVFRLHQYLIGLRRRHPWLHTARTSPLKLTNRSTSTRPATDPTRCWWRSTSTMRRWRCRCPNSASARAGSSRGRARRRSRSSPRPRSSRTAG